MQSELTLLVPGLLQPPRDLRALPPEEQPAFHLLNRFFSRSRRVQLPVTGFYATLFHLFGFVPEERSDYPVAALSRLADTGERSDDWLLRCDPACFLAGMDRVLLMGHGTLDLSAEDTKQLVTILNTHLQQDGWRIEAGPADRWYVKGAKQIRVSTTPPSAVLGKDIKHDLPTGADGAYWRSLMNECQMLLHEIPLNMQRQAQGLLPVNGLWFWGGGVLPENTTCQYDVVCTDDPLIAGLAQNAACEFARMENCWQRIQQQQNKRILFVTQELQSPLTSQDLFQWLDGVKQFEQAIIQPVLNMLKGGHLSQVTLLSADGRSFVLTPKCLRHWWKRKPAYRSLLIEANH